MATVDGTPHRHRRPRRRRGRGETEPGQAPELALTVLPTVSEAAVEVVLHAYRPWCRCLVCREYRSEDPPRSAPEWTEEDLTKIVSAVLRSAERRARWRLEGPWPRIVRWACIGSVLVIGSVAFGTLGFAALWLLLLACAISFLGGSA